MDNAKSFQPTPIIFTIGTLIGLAFGLLIGWVLWPVEWQGATLHDLDTTGKAEYIAAVADAFVIYDSPEAAAIAQQRLAPFQTSLDAEFVAAIRYFQSSAQPERAIRISNIGRLATSLGMVPPDLRASADTQNTLSGDTGQTAIATTGPLATTGNSNAPVTTATGTISWFRWLLWLLAALLLLGGGLYLLSAAGIFDWQQWLSGRFATMGKRSTVDEFGDFDQEEFTQSATGQSQRQGGRRNTFVTESEDLAFENEEDEVEQWRYKPSPPNMRLDDNWDGDDEFAEEKEFDDGFSPDPRNNNDQWRQSRDDNNPAHFTAESFQRDKTDSNLSSTRFEPQRDDNSGITLGRNSFTLAELANRNPGAPDIDVDDDMDNGEVPTVSSVMANATNRPVPVAPFEGTVNIEVTNDLDDGFSDDDFEDDDFGDDDFEESDFEESEQRAEENPSPTSFTQADADAIRDRVKQASLSPIQPAIRPPEPPAQKSNQAALPNRPPQTSRMTQQSTSPQRPARHKLIDQHTLNYQMGISEYDESKPIVDPSSGKYIGEFGMGTSSKNGVIQPNSDYIAALEVWLFDKSDEKNMGNQTRILLSEYAVDHNLEQAFVKERRDNPRPFTPQPNVHFQLESQNLLLDCTIVDVQYLTSGDSKGMFQSIKVDMSVHQK